MPDEKKCNLQPYGCNLDAEELHEIHRYDEERGTNRYATKPGKTRMITKRN
jgi:hypothetical protein